MARLARVIAPGMPHHVTQRGNPRQETFFGEEDVGPRHLPGDERPRARDPHPDRHWGLRPAVLQVAAPRAGRRAPPPVARESGTCYTLSGNFMRPLRYIEDCRRS